jgi:acetylornithine deacetylase/succinyl-diaminopimelate desuccinylase-like protein
MNVLCFLVQFIKITLMTFFLSHHDSKDLTPSQELTVKVRDQIERDFSQRVATLGKLVRIPGIAWDAFDEADLERSAQAVAELFRESGVFTEVEIIRSILDGKPGAPAVLASRPAKNGKPHILLYAHHDVQPPGDDSKWETPAFEPTAKNGRIYGRGAADDKAGVVAHLAAIETLSKLAGDDFDLGISIFIEGEEEAGSRTFRTFLDENKAKLEADVIIVADSMNWSPEVPALTVSLRGLVSLEFRIRTLEHAVHSGMFGGAVPDAMIPMVKVLAALYDDKGNVAVQGLSTYKFDDLTYSEVDLRADSSLLPQVSQIGDDGIMDRIWGKPALTIIGVDVPSVEMSSNTLMPEVSAKVSLRIAPGQDPESALILLKEHIQKSVPFGAVLEFGDVEKGKPFMADTSGWARELAKNSLESAFGNPMVEIGIGGSIPFIADLTEVFPNAQILVTGVEDADSRAHSPNESVHLIGLRNAMVAETLLLLVANDLTKD